MCLNETCSEFRTGKHFTGANSIHKGLKQKDGCSPLLYNFALEYTISNIQENQD
jgi:hypothetical protein